MSAVASLITSFTIVYSTVLYKAQIKENIKAPRHWPLWGEFTDDRWIPRIKGPVTRKMFSFDASAQVNIVNSTILDTVYSAISDIIFLRLGT